jgi:hypothetical protein
MNENDMDRYYWRTGHRWSGDYLPLRWHMRPLVRRTLLFLFAAYVVAAAILFLMRSFVR